jgi:IS30 family transposase
VGWSRGWRLHARATQRLFWRLIAEGLSTEDAARRCGVSDAAGTRWFREGGGMAPITLASPSGRYLSQEEREDIAVWRAQQLSMREIGRRLGRDPSTISRELARNAPAKGAYRGLAAQRQAELRACRPKVSKLAANGPLRRYVQVKLSGHDEDGMRVVAPSPVRGQFTGRGRGRRAVGLKVTCWSPEQIALRLPLDFPDDESMRISHEAIYQALYVQGRGALRRELTACLRTGRAVRKPRARAEGRSGRVIPAEIMISERPAEIEDRAVPGHWEGDLIIGADSSAIGTLVERTTRFTMLLHLPRLAERGAVGGDAARGWSGHGAEAVREAIAKTITTLPAQLRRSLTWDQGTEMAEHAQLRIDSGLAIYFCDPHSPWQRGTNENTNGLLRQYFPKGMELSQFGPDDLDTVAANLNGRPRKTLGFHTPAEAFNDLLSKATTPSGVATTP